MERMAAQLVSPQQLRDALTDYFNTDELRDLCFTLGIDYENLGGDSKSEKVLELIQYCERHGRTDDLINTIQRARPNLDWERLASISSGPAQKVQPFANVQQSPDQYLFDSDSGEGVEQSFVNVQQSLDQQIVEDTPPLEEVAEPPTPPDPFQTITTHNGTLLTERHGVRIYGLVTRQPWNLPVDAFVLPLGFGREYRPGLLGQELESALSSVQVDSPYKAFAQTVTTRTPPELIPAAPFILMHNSTDFWTVPGTSRKVIVATANDGHGRTIPHATAAATAVVQLAIANGLRRLTIPPLGAGTGGLPEQEVALAMVDSILTAIPPIAPGDPAALDEIIFTTINPAVLAALRQRFFKRPQAAVNDEPVGRDLLQVETAVYALAEMCMLNDLEPPLAVGILGGWGSGKSFVMHLMQQRIAHLRGRVATPNFPYVGHVYQIKFDAWTYAKSNLWASLMQTIFYDLNAQLTREREVAKTLARIPETADSQLTAEQEEALARVLRVGGQVWEALARPDLKPREVQDVVHFAAGLDKKVQSQELLWAELRQLKEAELTELRQTEATLAEKQARLEEARLKLREEVDAEIAAKAREAAWLPLQNAFKQQFGAVTDTIKQMFTAVAPTDSPSLRATFTSSAALWQMIRNNPTEFAAFMLLALFLAVMTFFSEQNQSLGFQLPPLPGFILSISPVILAFLRSYDKWVNLIRQSFVPYRVQ
ncbi:MAG TPA: P-loop NTPase fold protein, partial [Chloroflexota bacterium]|nr:P-loop NTPase fold protein [Chloroflexota bacterium]